MRHQRKIFANDPLNLIVADRQVNKDKADRDAGEWTPPDPRSRCITAAKMVLTKLRYQLHGGPHRATRSHHDGSFL
jgi:hypothetical protein